VVDYVSADPEIAKTGKSKDDIVEALRGTAFSDEMMAKPITGISGGWKMKLALTRCAAAGRVAGWGNRAFTGGAAKAFF
jgi:ATPase subunit of ABC transporter with duplicated ATPase domains